MNDDVSSTDSWVIQTIALAIVVEMIAGIMMAFFSIHNITICQQAVPNHLMGKVMSVRLVIIRTEMPIGVIVGGVVSELLGIRPLYVLIGSIIIVVSMIGIFCLILSLLMLHPNLNWIISEAYAFLYPLL